MVGSVRKYAVLALALGAAACESPVPTEAPAAAPSYSAVTTILPYAGEEVNPCNFEAFTFSGQQLFVEQTVVTETGVRFFLHISNQGVSGESADGTRYQLIQVNNTGSSIDLTDFSGLFTFTQTFNVISSGSDPNFILQVTFVGGFDENGLFVRVDNVVAHCTG